MTTIAYRDGVLAADTGQTAGGSRLGHFKKIERRASDGALAGASGDAGYCHAFLAWFLKGSEGEPPTVKEDRGVIFYRDGKIEVFEAGGKFPVDAPYYALGSGRPEALGAMFVGADAQTAVAAALEHDSGTFGTITVLSHDAIDARAPLRVAKG